MRRRNSVTDLVWCESSSVHGRHGADDGDKRDDHKEDVFCAHCLDVSEALEDHQSQPQEVHRGKEKPYHLNKRRQQVRVYKYSAKMSDM